MGDTPRSPEPPRGLRDTAAAVLRRHGWMLALLFAGVLVPMWVFAELADEVHEAEAIPFDEPLLLWAQAMAHEGFDHVFLFFSAIGHSWGVVPVDVLLVVVLLWRRRFRAALFATVALGGSGLLNVAAKLAFARERPSLWDSIVHETTYSFPSGHAMGSMSLALVLVLLGWPTRWRWMLVAAMAVFVPMVGLSRVYLGVHYPSDIIAGWMAASIWVMASWLLLMRGRGRDTAR
ncbi:hypothetical protein CO641_04390 [Lysobacteraceae bacterium NML91-0213]|nr:hypothetical protein CO641_04390 [Xanthomonadaceae bacterium NML91-0213]